MDNKETVFIREQSLAELKKKFVDCLSIQSNSQNEHAMVAYIIMELQSIDCTWYIDEVGNIIVYKGQSPYPCICSHMDTVHKFHDNFKIKANYKYGFTKLYATSYGKQVGIGGDDKCGVFACLTILKEVDNVMVVFFTQEESGTIGADGIDRLVFNEVQYLIEVDRCHGKDWINSYFGSYTTSFDFELDCEPVLNKHGYKEELGTYTDVMMLVDDVELCAVNISCGYYHQHSDMEYINLEEFRDSILFLLDLIDCLGTTVYPHIVDYTKTNYQYNSYNRNENIVMRHYLDPEDTAVCSCCGNIEDIDDIFYSDQEPMCLDCIEKFRLWEYIDK